MTWYIDDPSPPYSGIVRKFWWMENAISQPKANKIIPDGYPELIFHYGDPFEINIHGHWEEQAPQLVAGQIRKHFLLRNTGTTKTFGIKLQPWALHPLLDMDLIHLTDEVAPMDLVAWPKLNPLVQQLMVSSSYGRCIESAECFFSSLGKREQEPAPVSVVLQKIINTHGRVETNDLAEQVGVHERTLERHFRKVVGLSPKFYTRIIRFSHIIHLARQQHRNWVQIAYFAGFYDQSHFIKNFREFTGEEPTAYGFTDETMGNLHFKV